MHAVIHHTINDSSKWNESSQRIMTMIEQRRLPVGLKALQYLPCVDGKTAFCVWESNSLNTLRDFVDRETQGARNEYFEINVQDAVNLPKFDESMLAKAA